MTSFIDMLDLSLAASEKPAKTAGTTLYYVIHI